MFQGGAPLLTGCQVNLRDGLQSPSNQWNNPHQPEGISSNLVQTLLPFSLVERFQNYFLHARNQCWFS